MVMVLYRCSSIYRYADIQIYRYYKRVSLLLKRETVFLLERRGKEERYIPRREKKEERRDGKDVGEEEEEEEEENRHSHSHSLFMVRRRKERGRCRD
jgi:hypothetical protein